MSDCDVEQMENIMSQPLPGDEKDLIVVCDKCLRASCWHGLFMCDESQDAGTIEMTRKDLIDLGLEHPDYITNNPKPLW